ncbi:MAG: hypothetical protein HC806_10165 [Anaerolineae bacterium]|nr:hypothetical protein [Anaerolineae bacterium]
MADDFTVTDANGWDIQTFTFFAYQTGSTTSSTITAVNYRVWDGSPSDPGSVVVFGDTTTNQLIGSTWTNSYRVSEATSGTAVDRPIMSVVASAGGGFHLSPGTYWVDWQVDGSLASGSRDSTIAVRNPFGNFETILRGHTDYVNVVAWSDDGRLASASWDKTVILWDLENSQPERVFQGHTSSVGALDWGPDGKLATGAEFLFIWDTFADSALTTFPGHLDWTNSVMWMPDGRMVSSGNDGYTIFWDGDTQTISEKSNFTLGVEWMFLPPIPICLQLKISWIIGLGMHFTWLGMSLNFLRMETLSQAFLMNHRID